MPTATGTIGMAMKYFGRKPNQTLKEFQEEWHKLSDESKVEILQGLGMLQALGDVALTYPDRPKAD